VGKKYVEHGAIIDRAQVNEKRGDVGCGKSHDRLNCLARVNK
jgi:hypothetical protein